MYSCRLGLIKLSTFQSLMTKVKCCAKASSSSSNHGDEQSHQISENLDNFRAKDVKSFSDIPGPKPWPLLGNALLLTSYGPFRLPCTYGSSKKILDYFGPIVRFSKVTKGVDIVCIFRPDDLQKLFKEEGFYPHRPEIDILSFYRNSRKDIFSCGGLVTENGENWRRLRSAIPPLLKPSIVASYQEQQAQVADALVSTIDVLQNEKQNNFDLRRDASSQTLNCIDDLLPLLFRYTLEAVGVVCLGDRLNCLQVEFDNKNSSKSDVKLERSSQVIAANEDTLEAMAASIFSLPLHRFMSTNNYKKLSKAQDFISQLTMNEMQRLKNLYDSDRASFEKKNPLVASLFNNKDLSPRDILLLLVEILQGGIDATATTLAFCIYFLANHRDQQDVLFNEVKDFDPSTQPLQNLPFLKSVLKETYRLRPSAAAVGRVLQKDIVLSGYQVPAGTVIQAPPFISSRDPKTFPDPHKFNPLRWLKSGKILEEQKNSSVNAQDVQLMKKTLKNEGILKANEQVLLTSMMEETEKGHPNSSKSLIKKSPFEMRRDIDPYAVLPFGHGARMCPGRRLAEQEIYLALIKLTKTYIFKSVEEKGITLRESELSQQEEDDLYLKQEPRLNLMPSGPIRITFEKRTFFNERNK